MSGKMAKVLMAAALLAGNAYADTATCPPWDTIKQHALAGGGFRYTAPGPQQRQWEGENPVANESHLAAVRFSDAGFIQIASTVVCNYEGGSMTSVKLRLKPIKSWSAAPLTNWEAIPEEIEQRFFKGFVCAGADVNKCAFEYTK